MPNRKGGKRWRGRVLVTERPLVTVGNLK